MKLYIVYEEQMTGRDMGRWLKFEGEDAYTVSDALYDAEKAGGLMVRFNVQGNDYRLRTDKFLYWYTTD